jgi:hypothetical protein
MRNEVDHNYEIKKGSEGRDLAEGTNLRLSLERQDRPQKPLIITGVHWPKTCGHTGQVNNLVLLKTDIL